ncbi:MAG: ABC transporter ATP-binding protein, partial [Erysipelotrichaceae bacterium]|nr:ABC transporter ATP-binding protein [Erysipelotrichaceae bacterium]
HPSNLFVAGFIGTPQMNFFDARLALKNGEYYVEIDDISVKLSEEKQKRLREKGVKEQEVTLGVRPEHMNISDKGIEGRFDVTELMGSSCHLHMTIKDKDAIVIVPREGNIENHMGQKIHLDFSGNVAHVFSKEDDHNLEY